MARRTNSRDLAILADVQRVGMLMAEAALADARQAEREADAARATAQDATREAASAWNECLARAAFAPERSRALGVVLLLRDTDERAASERLRVRSNVHDNRRADWRAAMARADAAKDATVDARRAERRLREERAAIAIGDRVALEWSSQ